MKLLPSVLSNKTPDWQRNRVKTILVAIYPISSCMDGLLLARGVLALYRSSGSLTDSGPVASCEGGDAAGFGEEALPGVLAGIEDGGMAVEDPI